ncbi:hypothetical protein DV711_12405 [Motiliproteus coralliicola]|uniref:Uncharacterized protein n=1 Tax=Motiliproteus coralliicola TaxID=2283196 RepID=A0A369WCC8_9GAMM|nr:hypothetical protein [Motiliproteus coralliicola]RDE19678.1 hypothetical protein DV711_12405 [Motiliproteus coralliicola]
MLALSLVVIVPIFLLLLGVIFVSYCVVGLLAYLPLFVLKEVETKRSCRYGRVVHTSLAAVCLCIGFLMAALVFHYSKPLYVITADLWCDISGAFDATGRSTRQCDSQFRWLEQ